MDRRRIGWCVTVVLVTVAACSGGDESAPRVEAPDGVAVTQPLGAERPAETATDLAPSQIDGSTVPPPATVPACAADVVEFAAGDQVDGVEQVVDLINRGSVRCDVDISGTAAASADIEPSVVLGPGEIGHVWVSDRGGCNQTAADPQVEFDVVVNGVATEVTTTFVAYCGVELWAFFTD